MEEYIGTALLISILTFMVLIRQVPNNLIGALKAVVFSIIIGGLLALPVIIN